MSDLSDVFNALMAARASNTALGTWVSNHDARDMVRQREWVIERGMAAYHRLEAQLRDGRKHIEPPEDRKLTSCECSSPNAMPPCGYCTSGADDDN